MISPLIAFPPIIWDPRIELRIMGSILIVGCILMSIAPTRRFLIRWTKPWLATAVLAVVGGALALYLVVILAAPFFFDQTEYGVASHSWYWLSGHPMYPEPGTLDVRDIYPYGPLTFEIVAGPMTLLGPGVLAPKLSGLVASIVAFTCTFLALRRLGARTVLALFLMAAFFVVARETWVQSRLDPVSTAFVSISVLAATYRPSMPAFAIIGAMTGLSFALKIHGFVYTLPALAVLAAREGVKPSHAAAFLAAAIIAAVPPFLAPRVDFGDYVGVIEDASQDGLSTGVFLTNVLFMTLFIVAARLLDIGHGNVEGPPGALTRRQERFLLWALAICALAASVPASKPLAGPHHLLPFLVYVLPLAVAACLRHPGGVSPSAAPMLVFLLLAFQPVQEMAKIYRPAQAFWEDSLDARNLVAEVRASDPALPMSFCNPNKQPTWNTPRFQPSTAISFHALLAGAPLWREHGPVEGKGVRICASGETPDPLPSSCSVETQKRFTVLRCP